MPRYSARRGSYRRRYSSRRRRSSRLYSRYPRLTRGVRYVNARDTSVSNVKIVTSENYSLRVEANNKMSQVAFIPSFYSNEGLPLQKLSYCTLLSSNLYGMYSTIYDEVKIRGVQYQLTFVRPTSMPSSVSTFDVFTIMDRRFGNGETPRNQTNMFSACSDTPITFTDYRVPIVRRYYGARDVIERVQYHDCTLGRRGNYVYDIAYESMAQNPNFFSPCFQFSIALPVTFQQDILIPVNVRVVYYVTFRNPKGLNEWFHPVPVDATSLEDHVEVPGEVPAEVPDEVPPEVTYADSVVT